MPHSTEHMGKYISALYRSGSMYFNKNFEKYNIGSGQYPLLLSLSITEGITQEELSCKLSIDKGTTAKAIKKLEEEGYVKRESDNHDKRANKVYLTEEGRKIINDIFEVLNSWNNILTCDFTEQEKEIALNLLQRMLENKNKHFRKGECKWLIEKKD